MNCHQLSVTVSSEAPILSAILPPFLGSEIEWCPVAAAASTPRRSEPRSLTYTVKSKEKTKRPGPGGPGKARRAPLSPAPQTRAPARFSTSAFSLRTSAFLESVWYKKVQKGTKKYKKSAEKCFKVRKSAFLVAEPCRPRALTRRGVLACVSERRARVKRPERRCVTGLHRTPCLWTKNRNSRKDAETQR